MFPEVQGHCQLWGIVGPHHQEILDNCWHQVPLWPVVGYSVRDRQINHLIGNFSDLSLEECGVEIDIAQSK